MNEAAATLCAANPDLLDDRNTLLKQSRELVHNQGYAYAKGKSRSNVFSPPGSTPKRAKLTQEVRKGRIDEINDQIKDLSDQISYKEKRREQAVNVHDYKQCDMLTEQMLELKSERRKVNIELAQLKKRQKRSQVRSRALSSSSSDRSRSSTPTASQRSLKVSADQFASLVQVTSPPESDHDTITLSPSEDSEGDTSDHAATVTPLAKSSEPSPSTSTSPVFCKGLPQSN